MDIKEKIKKTPDSCGVYLIKDVYQNIIYAGKAASIRKRLRAHFARSNTSVKQRAIIEAANDIDHIPTSSPEAALLLEAALIKRYLPKYNAALKDDKSYPVLKLTVNEEFPRLLIARRKNMDGALYFGPYTNAMLLRKAFKLIGRIFPLRSCRAMPPKVCLDYHIGQCLAPCIDNINKQEYKRIAENVALFLKGETEELKKILLEDMEKASMSSNFELAAKIRDQIQAISFVTGIDANFSSKKLHLSNKPIYKISAQIESLSHKLNLSKPPDTIEAFDISNTSGKEAVGSMIVFKNGRPHKDEYRKFRIRTVNKIDDYSMMAEIVQRRYFKILQERSDLPDLILIDGGKGHLMSVKKQLHKLGIWEVPAIAIAKKHELIYTDENKAPAELDPSSPASLLIQRIRDEAHRFAISYHRLLRSKKLSQSELDSISGLGITKKKLLFQHFGSMDEIKMAEVEDLRKVKYINEKQARKIYDYFNKV